MRGDGAGRVTRHALPLLVAAMAALALAGAGMVRSLPRVSPISIPAWVIAILFACAELVVISVPVRSERYSHSLSDLPLVASLFFLSPLATLIAQVAGTTVVLLLGPARQRGVKLVFNMAQVALQSLVAVLAFRVIIASGDPRRARTWLAAIVAVQLANMSSALLVAFAVRIRTGAVHSDLMLWILITTCVAATANTALALLGVVAIERHAASAVLLLVVVTAVMFAAFRAYASLHLSYQRVEKLYGFTRSIAATVAFNDVSERALREARDVLRARGAELMLHDGLSLVCALDHEGVIKRRGVSMTDAPMIETMRVTTSVTSLTRGGRGVVDLWLARQGWQHALLAPLAGEHNVGWLAVGRAADDEPFSVSDEQLFEALANNASVALENGRLVEELSAEARERERRALHDPLTELPNRVQLTEMLTAAITSDDEPVAVFVIGLDSFREINEALGHDHGDDVLREVADRLRDLSQSDWTAARLGGDEFAIVVPDVGGVGAAVRTGELVARAFDEQPFHVAGLVIALNVHVGIAVHPDHGSSAQQLLRRAEIALRAGKRRHARVSLFVKGDDPHTPRQLVLAHQLRRALENEELTVYVQPEFDLVTNNVARVEVLARWFNDDGAVPPDEFIEVAERTGLIRPLTQYVLTRALEHRRQWVAAGYDIPLSVNVSIRDLVDPAFPEQVAVALTRAVCPASALTLEVTETQIMLDPERVAAALRRLRILGVEMAIDDFGTGYSSLTWLRELQADELKIDRSFVQNAATDEQDGTLVRSLTNLAHGLGLRVVAEGVEDGVTLALLCDAGVDVGQGFGLVRPMPAVDLPGWLAARDTFTLEAR